MIDYEAFFRVMKIREEQIKRRIQTALELEDEFFWWLSEFRTENETEQKRALARFKDGLEGYVARTIEAPVFATEYADKVGDSVFAFTMERLEAEREKGRMANYDYTPYVLSRDRASILAAGAALAIWMHKEYVDAYADGFTQKTWHSLLDGKERADHGAADGQTVGIDEFFTVGGCQMLYPGDIINGEVEQTANCRCWLTFSGKGEEYDYTSTPDDIRTTERTETPDLRVDDDVIEHWLLNSMYPHYADLTDIGYTKTDPEQLKRDIIATYYASNPEERASVKGTLLTYVSDLGVTDSRQFNFVWAREDGENLIRFLTLYKVVE